MARAALGLDVGQLAAKAGISPAELSQFEAGGSDGAGIAARIREVLEQAGIEMIEQDGVRLKAQPDKAATILVENLNSYNDE
jgi:transcriptional regulator with XRE-family HTH domain